MPEGKTLDYILLSHTHYDHIGALPYVLQVWPEAQVCGLQKPKRSLPIRTPKRPWSGSETTPKRFIGVEGIEITAAGMRVDRVLADGDSISLGAETITAYETKGIRTALRAICFLRRKFSSPVRAPACR